MLALALTWARSVEPAARAGTAIPRIAAVGDIACKNPPANNRSVCQYDDVAAAIGAGDYDKVLLLGDIQYEAGIYQDFVENFDVYFGDLLPSTAPAPGNHEYGDPGAAGYFRYFGSLAPGSSYSFDLGAWHIISLDSTICGAGGLECLPGSPQHSWLARDLAEDDSLCTLAFWHHPRWDWLKYQNADWTEDFELLRSKPLWDLLYAHDADLVLSGHNHNYSRWQPRGSAGRARPRPRDDPVRRRDRRPQPERLRQLPHPPGHLRPGPVEGVRLPRSPIATRRMGLPVDLGRRPARVHGSGQRLLSLIRRSRWTEAPLVPMMIS